MSDAPAVIVDGLRKSFDDIVAVDGVTFDVAAGEIVRVPRTERRRQVHDDQHPVHAAPPDRGQRLGGRVRRRDPARRRPPPHRPRLPGPDPRRVPHRRGEPPLPRRAVRRPARDHRGRGCSEVLEMVGLWERREAHGRDVLRRDEAPARDRPRAAALAAGAVPRRADRRARPADPRAHLELHRRAPQARGDHDLPDHALHGRGRALRPDRDHRPRRRSSRSTPRRR